MAIYVIAYLFSQDVLIHCGDFSSTGRPSEIKNFLDWFESFPHPFKVVIAGNHEATLHTEFYESKGKSHFHPHHSYNSLECRAMIQNHPSIIYLEDSSTIIQMNEHALKIYGSPWQPEFFEWAFNLPRGDSLRSKWDLIPIDTDILITHGPPYGILDKNLQFSNVGCVDLYDVVVNKVQPRVHLFGHIHESYGNVFNGKTLFANCSTCNLSYRPINPPVIIYMPFDKSKPAQILRS